MDWTGFTRAVTSMIPKKRRNAGFRNFPTESRILEGFREKNSTAPKKHRENPSCQSRMCSPTKGDTPMVKLVAAQRGMANRGPMVR